jgi:hypothetical protein
MIGLPGRHGKAALSQTKQTIWQGFPVRFSSQIPEIRPGKAGSKPALHYSANNAQPDNQVMNENDFQK